MAKKITKRKHSERKLEEKPRRFRRYNNALRKLTGLKLLKQDTKLTLEKIAEIAAKTLEVERVNIWLFNVDRSKIECIEHYDQSKGRHSMGMELLAEDYPAYFNALQEERFIAVYDAHNDPRTREFSKTYLRKHGISSMLDVPIRIEGMNIGVVCHEHVGTIRRWTEEEKGFAGSLADIVSLLITLVDRNKAEVSLKESDAKYRSLVESTNAVTWKLDLTSGKFIYIGHQVEKMLGYPAESWDDFDTWRERIHPEDRDEAVKFCVGASERGEDHNFEYRMITADGRVVWINDFVIIADGDEGQKKLIGFWFDITERKKAEVSLKESEEKFRNFVESSIDLVFSLNKSGVIEYISPMVGKLYSIKSDELIGKHFKTTTPIKEIPKVQHLIESVLSGKTIKNFRINQRGKKGRIVPMEISAVPIMKDGKVVGVQGVMRDISERKQLEEKLQRAQRMESLGLLAGGVAHDLNNIIGPIMAYPDLIKINLSEGKAVDEELDIIRSSAQRAADVIADLLALTRRGKYKMEPIELNELINDYLIPAEWKSTKELYPEVKPDIQLSEDRLLFKGSKAHLPKVIMNLIINSCESMREGGTLTITSSSINIEDGKFNDIDIPQGRYNLLTIEDQGEGILEENISKIFDPFFTTKMNTAKSGTGLGLSVVYNVLKDHGAYIDVESKLGIGSKFSIYFPETTEDRERVSEVELKEQGRGSILVVDDRKGQRNIAIRLLSKLRYDVDGVESGQEAIKYLKKKDVDLVLLDMILEDDMDGFDTYKEIIKTNPDQKTIIVSGYSESDRVKEAEKLGVNGFIQKPYGMNEIGLTIKTALAGSEN
ncbi:MAG: PAS domain S-box protein [Candidatus Marinimicrobia bacterium]|nr:PAS domain S-box protein [Candidatus Neomarinimicrobiota bacterium]